jgi:hypothetical protein
VGRGEGGGVKRGADRHAVAREEKKSEGNKRRADEHFVPSVHSMHASSTSSSAAAAAAQGRACLVRWDFTNEKKNDPEGFEAKLLDLSAQAQNKKQISKVLSKVIMCSNYTRALTFEFFFFLATACAKDWLFLLGT